MSKIFRRPMFRRGGGVKTMDGVMHGIETRSMNNLGGRIGYAFGTEQLVQGDTPQTLGPVTHGKGISNIDTGNFDLSNSAEYTQMYPSDGGIDIDIDLRQIAKVAQGVGIPYKQLLAMTKQVSQQYGLGLKAALKVIMNQLAEGDVSLLDQLEGDQGANVEEFGSSDLVPFNDRSGINTVRNGKEDVPEELTALVQGVRPGKQEGGLMNLSGRIGFAEKGTTNPEIADIRDSINLIDQVGGPAPDHLAQLLISGGLNLVSGVGAGTGSKLGDVAAAYKGPTAQAFKGMATDRSGNKVLAATLLKGLGTSDMDKVIRSGKQIAKQFNLSEDEGIKIAFNRMYFKDELTQETIDRNAFKERWLPLTKPDDRGKILISVDGAKKTIRAYDKLRETNEKVYKKVYGTEMFLQDKIRKGSSDDGKGNLKPNDIVKIKLNTGQVYYSHMDDVWYEFDGKLLRPVA